MLSFTDRHAHTHSDGSQQKFLQLIKLTNHMKSANTLKRSNVTETIASCYITVKVMIHAEDDYVRTGDEEAQVKVTYRQVC